jgi:uncharacterized protein
MSTDTAATVPFHTFLWKIASRCNIDCSYCYVYQLPDQGWRRQPKLMSRPVAERTATAMREHLARHQKGYAAVTFHGGEPLLGGVDHLAMLCQVIDEQLRGAGVDLQIGMQSNGLLFSREIGDLMLQQRITVGISLDGPPAVNDLHRVDHRGRPTGARLEEKLELLLSPTYRRLFTSFLTYINIGADPVEVTEYLLSWEPPSLDFLFPLDNHDRRPLGKEELEATPYGDWLIASFDHWWERGCPARVRIFDSILMLLCGSRSLVESLGLSPVDLVVVETNGEIEGVDSLKATYDGAPRLGFNVFDHDFDQVAAHQAVRQRQNGLLGLCQKCRECPVVEICGGGYLPHRYSAANGFDNPSVYSADLEKLIRHIHATLHREVVSEPALALAV